MENYIGTKNVKAKPMTRKDYSDYRNWDLAEDENGDDEGYLVEYDNESNKNHKNHEGYISWLPKNIFEKAYRKTHGLNFGLAIEAMKKGCRVARKGWNGKGIFIEIQNPDENSKMSHPYIFIDTSGLVTDNKHAPKNRVPWLASQTDMLSDDWMII